MPKKIIANYQYYNESKRKAGNCHNSFKVEQMKPVLCKQQILLILVNSITGAYY